MKGLTLGKQGADAAGNKKATWKNLISKIDGISEAFDKGQAMLLNSGPRNEDELFGGFVNDTIGECERLFSSEESFGKYLDLNEHY